ncbi:response regulator [Flavobacterium flavigenum]|uniref:response regulator n=1 Tax=Flavobacterium flavigenum TaxID=3003258 RepID=UPI0022AC2E15|nr:response regulator [Flavobacterium flavigenum]
MQYQNILLIDDDDDDREIFKEAVKSLGNDILYTDEKNPNQALVKLRKSELLPDIIFLDYNMPDMNGQEFIIQIRNEKRLKDIPVILYSAYSKEAAEQLLLTNGNEFFISKPYNFEDLKNILKDVLNISD